MSILVTGASGFIGTALTAALAGAGYDIVRAGRAARAGPGRAVAVGDVGPHTDWGAALEGVDTVIHLAAPAHRRTAPAELQRVTVEGARALAAQSARAGVSRFVLVSSALAVAAAEPYGQAKREAERAVQAFGELRAVVLRPPLVVGPGARANAALLLRAADTPLPAPLAGFRARRSYLALSSLVAALERIVARADGPAGVFALADRPSLTIGEAFVALRAGLGRPARLFAAPAPSPRQWRAALELDDTAFRNAYGYGPFQERDAHAALAQAAAAWKAARG